MKLYIVAIVLIPLFILAGCTYYDDDHAYDDHSSTQTQNMSTNINNSNKNADGTNNYLNMQNSVTNQIANNQSNRIQVADEIATELDEWNEIERANVIIYNNNAFVSVVLNNTANINNHLFDTISQHLKTTDRDIENVYISSNPEYVRELALLMNKINFQRENHEIIEQFNKTIRGEFPNANL